MHRNPSNPAQYIGADDVEYEYLVSLDGIEHNPHGFVGILIDKCGNGGADLDDNLFGYWPASPSEVEEGGWEIDDVYTSLPELCEKCDLSLDAVIDRIAIAMLRFAQKCERKGRR